MRRAISGILAIGACGLAACEADDLSSSTTGTSTSTQTTTSTATGGSGGTTTTGAGGTGGEGGSGGAGGATTTSAGGGTTTTGEGGQGGGGGGQGGSGGGQGGSGGGQGGGGATGTLLVLAGGIPDSSARAATWSGAAGWTVDSFSPNFKEIALAPAEGGALAVLRYLSFNPPMGDNELWVASWTAVGGFGASAPTGAFAKDAPALAPHGVATMLAVLDTTNKHVFAQHEAGQLGPFGPVPAGMPGSQAFGPSGPALVPFGAASVYISYSGDDEKLYMSVKSGPGGAWTPSQQVPVSLTVNAHTPAVVVDGADDLHLFHVRKSDGRVCTASLITPQNAWNPEEAVHTDAITNRSPAAALLPNGDILVAWHGFDNNGIYFSRRQGGVWSAPVTVEEPAMPSSAPVVVVGLGGADAEILYTAGAKLRWARVSGTTATFGPDPGVSNVSSLAALVVP